jgi:Kdo2-lipid IVA lauroyltransferase/acyltransferase
VLQRGVDYAVYLLVRVIVAVLQTLPEDGADRFCHQLAWLLARYVPLRRGTIDENLRRAFGADVPADQLTAMREAMWHHLLLMVCEIAWAPRRLHRSNWKQHMRFGDDRMMLRVLLSRRPAVLVSGHFGNFELGGYVTGLMGLRTTVIARDLDNPYLHRFVKRFRGATGQSLVDKRGCAADVDRLLSSGGTLSLLADQHAGDRGCWVDFLGHPASCHKALALFSLTRDAPMLVATTRRSGGPMQFVLDSLGVVDPREPSESLQGIRPLTQWYNDRLAEGIRLAPEQYWWVHRRWRPRRARRSAGAKRAA